MWLHLKSAEASNDADKRGSLFMQELIQNLGAKGAPSHLRKSRKHANLSDILGWLGAPSAPRSCNYKIWAQKVPPATLESHVNMQI